MPAKLCFTFIQLLHELVGDLFQFCFVNAEYLFKMFDLCKKVFGDIGERSCRDLISLDKLMSKYREAYPCGRVVV